MESGLYEFEGDGEGWGPTPEKFWHNMRRTVFYNLSLNDLYYYFFLKFCKFVIGNDNQL